MAKPELKSRKLTDEDIKKRRQAMEELELQLFDTENEIRKIEEEIKREFPMKRARNLLRKLQNNQKILDSNIKVYEKQIRTKTEKYM